MDSSDLPDFLAIRIGRPFAARQSLGDGDDGPEKVWPVVDEGGVVREFVTFAELASSGVFWRPLDAQLEDASWSDGFGIVAWARGEEFAGHTSGDWVKLSEAARRLSVHPRTLHRWRTAGDLAKSAMVRLPGGQWRISVAALEQMLAARAMLPGD